MADSGFARVWARLWPVLVVMGAVIAVWYAAAVGLNAPQVIERFARDKIQHTRTQLVEATWSMKRPLLPAPHQVAADLRQTIFDEPINTPQNLLFHTWSTSVTTLTGFVLGALLGILLGVMIVHMRTLERGVLPWIIASQAVPILAIAPIVMAPRNTVGRNQSATAQKCSLTCRRCRRGQPRGLGASGIARTIGGAGR